MVLEKELNISIDTDKTEYKPGENLEISFETTNENSEKVDAALLVSILDEAILNLASNDLSIDNIKLALEDEEVKIVAREIKELSEEDYKVKILKITLILTIIFSRGALACIDKYKEAKFWFYFSPF